MPRTVGRATARVAAVRMDSSHALPLGQLTTYRDGSDAKLDATGDLPPGAGAVLRRVPREWFVPDRSWAPDGERYRPIDRAVDPEAWLAAVYRNAPIVTQFDDGQVPWPLVGDRPACSASMPSVVLGMLSALDVQPGQSVLEIGTGTGFNAALLASWSVHWSRDNRRG